MRVRTKGGPRDLRCAEFPGPGRLLCQHGFDAVLEEHELVADALLHGAHVAGHPGVVDLGGDQHAVPEADSLVQSAYSVVVPVLPDPAEPRLSELRGLRRMGNSYLQVQNG